MSELSALVCATGLALALLRFFFWAWASGAARPATRARMRAQASGLAWGIADSLGLRGRGAVAGVDGVRVLLGARVSWIVGLIVVGVSSVVGATMGSIAGYFGGRVDDVISRAMDVLMAFPGLLLAIALVAALGPSLTNVVVALTLIGWVSYARLVRGQVLRAREFEYVQAARALGASTPRLLVRHIVPTALPALSVQATLGMGGAILAEASLSFLGLGVQPPTPSWGTMLAYGLVHVLDAPHLTIFPGIAIAALVLGFNFLGDGLRDALDPSSRGREV